MVLVTGATGHQGGAVLRHLRMRGFPVRALTRDPNQQKARDLAGPGVDLVRGDLDDRNSLVRALDEVYGVFSVQDAHQAGSEGEIRQGIGLADAARRSDISHFVYSSVASADQRTGIPHFDSKFRIEEHIRSTGLKFTVLRPVFFMENWLGQKEGIDAGTLALPIDPGTRLQMVAVDNIGEAAAHAFEHTGKWQDRVFDLAGDELSMSETAEVFSRATGREVRYVQTPWADFETHAGPEMTRMFRWFQEKGYHVDISAVRQEIPDLLSLEQWIRSAWNRSVRTAR
ncbi:MAG TPA: NmrA/HSCARG family protein [Candidatus Sulfopaludibacter sp.]|jgi:uncharacterized protein YbjT (DUF2867 family)|nr:NmrA/HSCARG family protein [Candidatus Sulfopaludibacter sp.]